MDNILIKIVIGGIVSVSIVSGLVAVLSLKWYNYVLSKLILHLLFYCGGKYRCISIVKLSIGLKYTD